MFHTVDCNLVDCRDIDPSECNGAAVIRADPSIGRCCDTCGKTQNTLSFYFIRTQELSCCSMSADDPCERLICPGPDSQCQVQSGEAVCVPLCRPGSCPPGQHCSVRPPLSCLTPPCPPALSCTTGLEHLHPLSLSNCGVTNSFVL